MLDIKFIRDNSESVRDALKKRGDSFDLDAFLKLDEERREFIKKIDALRTQQNRVSSEVGSLIKQKKDAQEKISEGKRLAEELAQLEEEAKRTKESFQAQLLVIPNVPHVSLPVGGASCNKVIATGGGKRDFDFKPLSHMELSEHLDIIDLKRAAKVTGSNFTLFKGPGAYLERAIINFMLDLHTKEHGYKEIFPSFLVNRASMTATGQLPKLEEDMYRLKDDDYFLIPTAEVPLTNMYRDEVMKEEELPLCYAAYTACFRREAGSYGKDTKGLMRVHQFDKVELVKFVKPNDSCDELERLLKDALRVLELLKIPYRVVLLATGDISFAASKCYDIEIYAPGIDKWLEVSSCSNFEDFQARRGNIRYRDAQSGKLQFVHTLNGSGVALARLVVSIIENYQDKDGSVTIPEALRRYMDGRERITK